MGTIRVTIKFLSNSHAHGHGNRRLKIQERVSDRYKNIAKMSDLIYYK